MASWRWQVVLRIACPIRKISWRRIAGDDPRDKQIICSSPTTDSRRVRPVDGDRVGGRWGAPRRPVGILCPNAPEFLRALFAVHHTGAAACPLPLPFGLRELTETELLATCVTTVVAGHETTANLVSGGLLALMRDPAQLALLRERPGLIPSAVDELLRMKPPVQMTTRTTLRDTTLAGQELPAGTGVVVLINSANRDPDVYPDPDRLDVTRYHDRHRPPGTSATASASTTASARRWHRWRWRSCSAAYCAG